jgi:DNA sulfur modification protein DndD
VIFEKLVLHNFGIYAGKHELPLEPTSPGKPITLIGGMNGGGKTTILDAIQLAMYGKLANCSNRGTLPYDEYLLRCINKTAQRAQGAAVELSFRHRASGNTEHYRVRRSWTVPSDTAREKVQVFRNEKLDMVVTDAWLEYAEVFLPSGLAPLFLFDGEKIEQLADPANSSEMLRTAVHALLGLDVVDQLSSDLTVVERRKHRDLKNDELSIELDELEERLEQVKGKRSDCTQQAGGKRNLQIRAEKRLALAEENFKMKGGDLYERRSKLETEIQVRREGLTRVEEDLRDHLSGALPLLLVKDLVARVATQHTKETAASRARILSEMLSSRDEGLIAFAEQENAPNKLVANIRDFLNEDREKRSASTNIDEYLGLSPAGDAELQEISGGTLTKLSERTQSLVDEEEGLRRSLDDLDRQMTRMPQPEAIAQLDAERDSARLDVLTCEKELAHLEAELDECRSVVERLEEERKRLLRKDLSAHFGREDSGRIIEHSRRVRSTMEQFRRQLIERNVGRIADCILESFQHLLRKKSLAKDLHIDSKTFAVSLVGNDGKEVTPDRLSAGERQLLATSILWGLARASGRALPMVIDTPLGRLDSKHRGKLIERYFPSASHQVILLSTDEEIVGEYLTKLRPSISHQYLLEFDEATHSGSIQTGYFE